MKYKTKETGEIDSNIYSVLHLTEYVPDKDGKKRNGEVGSETRLSLHINKTLTTAESSVNK